MKTIRFLFLLVLVAAYVPRLGVGWIAEKCLDGWGLVKTAWNHCA